MLQTLSIENYALIQKLEISFGPGLTVITGETGAGKSIILGALGLILGNRADTQVLRDNRSKCIVEGTFNIKGYGLENYFSSYDIDFDENTIIRREINTAGKTRAFINDTPVNLNQLKEFGDYLVDIHSQHETLYLRNPYFQLEVLDHYAANQALLADYQQHYLKLKKILEQLNQAREQEKKSKLDHDYYLFLFNELEAAGLEPGEQERLEEEMSLLGHASEIKTGIQAILELLDLTEYAALRQISEVNTILSRLGEFHSPLKNFETRLKSVYIETKDIYRELESLSESVQTDPARMEWIQGRLDTIYNLQKKHRAANVDELITIYNDLDYRLQSITTLEEKILKLEKEAQEMQEKVNDLAHSLSDSRKTVVPQVEDELLDTLLEVGMPNARFSVDMKELDQPGEKGSDQVRFLFSANKGSSMGELSRVASGGELSRVMLGIKSMVSRQKLLPTLIFDEIDMGVSGEIASRVGMILTRLSETKQLIVITHLPQIAGKGKQHYYVYKISGEKETTTEIRPLSDTQRVEEIARMISGDSYSDNTLETARELLVNNTGI
ncbi:MAG: DNA repair protein RecN [Bacteroidetes bacterium]|nr:DNA repair protein RecN [Bacteroidota bacterium]